MENEIFCEKCGCVISRIKENEYRVEWDYGKKDLNSIRYEIKKYNEWARKEAGSIEYSGNVKERWYKYELYNYNPPINERIPILEGAADIEGWDILDIGGSCVDSWRFLPAGASSINQVEPASESQRLGIRRLDKALSDSSINWRDKVLFHTVVAEKLPFQEDTFDMVFSRSSIHHTSRPRSISECFRVLRPGGYFLIIEPRHGKLLSWIRSLYRKLNNSERGADSPLSEEDMSYISENSRKMTELRYNIFNPLRVLLNKKYVSKKAHRVTNESHTYFETVLDKSFIMAKS